MAFPTVVNSATSGATGTSLTWTLPASIVPGNLLLCVYGDNTSDFPSVSGWTKLVNDPAPTVYARVATGSDAGTISGTSSDRMAIVYQISGWHGSITNGVFYARGGSLSLDPPALDCGYSDDMLWVAGVQNNANTTGAPTNYTDYIEKAQGSWQLSTAVRQLTAQSENPGAFAGTLSTTIALTIAVAPPEVFGDIRYEGNGAISASATNPAVAYPSGIAAGDMLVMVVGQKPSTANSGTVTTPSGWALAGSLTGAGGYGATLGADTGNTNLYAFTKEATGSESGSLTVTTGTNSVAWGWMHRLSSAIAGTWDVAVATGSDTTAGSVSVTFGADPGVQSEDYILAAMCIPTDVTTPNQFSAQALTQTGVTFGTVRGLGEPDSSLGNDIGGFMCRARVLSGTSSAAPVMTATASGTTTNVRGPAAFIRVRRVASGGPPASTGNFFSFFA